MPPATASSTKEGGDPASHFGGTGPLIATTVFEGLVDMGVNLDSLPGSGQVLENRPGLELY